jgi:hypothetical protein
MAAVSFTTRNESYANGIAGSAHERQVRTLSLRPPIPCRSAIKEKAAIRVQCKDSRPLKNRR